MHCVRAHHVRSPETHVLQRAELITITNQVINLLHILIESLHSKQTRGEGTCKGRGELKPHLYYVEYSDTWARDVGGEGKLSQSSVERNVTRDSLGIRI